MVEGASVFDDGLDERGPAEGAQPAALLGLAQELGQRAVTIAQGPIELLRAVREGHFGEGRCQLKLRVADGVDADVVVRERACHVARVVSLDEHHVVALASRAPQVVTDGREQ